MRRITFGVVAGGAAAAAFFGAATANADPAFDPTYTVGDAALVQAPGSQALTFELPASFTSTGTSADPTTLMGTDYITPSMGGYDNEFVTGTGAIYDQNQLASGFTNLYYDPSATGTAVDMLKTPFGEFNISPFASVFAPTDPSTFLTSTDVLGNAGLYSALNLGVTDATGETFTPTYTDLSAVANPGSAPVLESTAQFVGTGGTPETLNGTDYLAPSLGGYDNEFVTNTGAIYDQDQLGAGFTNLYYDPSATGSVVDMLKTPFGEINITPFASLFTPTDYTDAVAASPLTDLQDAGLYSALELTSASTAASGAMADGADAFGGLFGGLF